MQESEKISRSSFQEMLETVTDNIGLKKLVLRDDFFKEYCELTGHDYSLYKSRDLAPAGFFMSFAGSTISDFLFNFFVKYPKILKGFIHSSSTVNFIAPINLSAKNFTESLAIKKVEEKSGKKGDYFVVDFEVVLMDESGKKLVVDLHQFFLRV